MKLGIKCAALFGLAMMASLPGAAYAAKECSAFTVTIRNAEGVAIGNPIRPGTRTTLRNIPAGAVLRASGRFVQFDVDLDTLAVGFDVDSGKALLGQFMTGAAVRNPDDGVTNVRTLVFRNRVPGLGTTRLIGAIDLRVDPVGNGQLVIERSGGGQSMKIQAKDCSQGGIFQMEPEPRVTETNNLGPTFVYCYQANPGARRFFVNNEFLGYDSPEGTTTVVQGFSAARANGIATGFERRAVWSVADGGRVGMIIGEDARQALALEAPAARTACRLR